ncbi:MULTISPECIES: hypothetical protein [Pectobacterium]|uniref:hypothetical protein n=1 Tax=Pectobacterium TaxID=122277 RepID=UPI000DC6417D|nr:hypothetical protein [Pectobacterium parvum]
MTPLSLKPAQAGHETSRSRGVHLITTCSKGKTVPAGDVVFPYETLPIDEAMTIWRQKVQTAYATGGDVRPTASLYCGVHWGKAIALAQQFSQLELWVISAGLGLRHSADPAVPYEATFKGSAWKTEIILR